ncbi:MAG TPA: nickel pincer cofactor biosynthesis protein LarC [Pyrinomonadaceae bacterium]|nr:nickel pincer cofactor biosynthesis protein LarC [Pyrinomonadaceae bacterium]
MTTLYFDCFAGASGDMILGALVAAGVDPQALREQLALLDVEGFSVDFEKVDRAGLSCTFARVSIKPEHVHRHLSDVLKIIYDSRLNDRVKERAARIFSRLAEAEASVHNQPVASIHFHEVGALDAIVDVVGAAICFDLIQIDRFVCSPLHVGSGTVDIAHGRFPVPPPAVAELLKHTPVYATDIKGELVTPTGAAIIAAVCDEYGPLPLMQLERSGYGAGSRTYENFPNAIRVLIGKEQRNVRATQNPKLETLWMLETNIDDMSPQVFGHVMDRALEMGALDCYFTPIQMKKNRPGVLLSVLCRASEKEAVTHMLFAETTTIGIRSYAVERSALERQVVKVETQYGAIDVKVARMNGHVVNEMPEFDQVQSAAIRSGVPFRTVERAVREALANASKV